MPAQYAISQVVPKNPASHLHAPFVHDPRPPHPPMQIFVLHMAPPHAPPHSPFEPTPPLSHTHLPVAPSHLPCPMQLRGHALGAMVVVVVVGTGFAFGFGWHAVPGAVSSVQNGSTGSFAGATAHPGPVNLPAHSHVPCFVVALPPGSFFSTTVVRSHAPWPEHTSSTETVTLCSDVWFTVPARSPFSSSTGFFFVTFFCTTLSNVRPPGHTSFGSGAGGAVAFRVTFLVTFFGAGAGGAFIAGGAVTFRSWPTVRTKASL